MKKSALFCLILMTTTCTLLSQENVETNIFVETFNGKLSDGWHWLREEPQDWRIKTNALEICARPGDAHSVKNALVRPAPDRTNGKYAIEVTITHLTPPTNQFEQAGITWYCNGKPVFKFIKELVDGKLIIIPGRKPITNDTVQLRLIVDKTNYIAQYRPNAEGEYLTATTGNLPPPDNDEVSIQCYHGTAETKHWVKFTDFKIIKFNE